MLILLKSDGYFDASDECFVVCARVMRDGGKVPDLAQYDMTPSDIGERHHTAEANGRDVPGCTWGVILITSLCCCVRGLLLEYTINTSYYYDDNKWDSVVAA